MNLPHLHTMFALESIWNGDGTKNRHTDEWLDRADGIDIDAYQRHMNKHFDADSTIYDADSGLLSIDHAILRLMCVSERLKRRLAAKSGD